jgi:hypothetical protein
VPEKKELEIQLDMRGRAELELVAKLKGMTPEEMGAFLINKALSQLRPDPSRSNVRAFRKG